MNIIPPASGAWATMPSATHKSNRPAVARFTEADAWRDVGAGWQPIFGSFRGVGYSIAKGQA